MNFNPIKNIIFDLGAVIINIDVPLAYKAFSSLNNQSVEEIKKKFEASGINQEYEKGNINDADFLNSIRKELGINATDSQITDAWNALLMDLPEERIERIRQLRTKYNLYLLSNTNIIHINSINNILQKNFGIESIKHMFDKAYLSYEIGLIKPYEDIYEYVLKDSNLNKEETVFLDDNADNIKGADKVGIHTIHVTAPHTMIELLTNA